MAAIKLEHGDVAKHGFGMIQELREFRKEGHLCDVVLKSNDGIEHRAHAAVLSAASKALKNLLGGSFQEADQRKSGLPVEMAASANVVSALLDYIYGGQPELPVSDSIELLRLADAYDCPTLAAAVETGVRTCLDSPQVDMDVCMAVLQQTHGLHGLKTECEPAVAKNFTAFIQHPDFVKLDACQLGRIIERVDLKVPREEEVLKGVLIWFKHSSEERCATLSLLLRDVDFEAISSRNLAQVGKLASSIGPSGDALQRRVSDALQAHKKRSAAERLDSFRPKRQCLQHWSPHLGARSEGFGREIFSKAAYSFCLHEGAIYATTTTSGQGKVVHFKPGETETAQTVAGEGAGVAGVNELGKVCKICILPDGNIIVADLTKNRLVSFQNGSGQLVVGDVESLKEVTCSPNGVVYIVTQDGQAVHKFGGTTLQPMLQPVILSEHLPEEMRFRTFRLFVTSEEVVYFSDHLKSRVLRISPGETQPVVVCKVPVPESQPSFLGGLCLAEDGTIYVADQRQCKVFAFNPSDETSAEVLACPHDLWPDSIMVRDRSLYVGMYKKKPSGNSHEGGIHEYFLSPEVQLE